MQRRLLDILACPIDKYHPLRLIELEATPDTIISGVLTCKQCNRYYPVIDEIPVMLPDELRKKDEDLAFLNKWKDKLPKEIVQGGQPTNLSSPSKPA
jgi:uncharacterized protein YbaR (Trm112 family)